MSFFSAAPWSGNPWADVDPNDSRMPKTYYNPKQQEIEFFYPLTEQIELDLDYGPTHLHFRAKGIAGTHSMPIQGSTYEFTTVPSTWATVSSTVNTPTLSVQPTNSIGQLNIGGIQIGMEKQPTWYQKVIYKLLGFNWKDKD